MSLFYSILYIFENCIKNALPNTMDFLLPSLMYIIPKLVYVWDNDSPKSWARQTDRQTDRERIGLLKRSRNYNGTGVINSKLDPRRL